MRIWTACLFAMPIIRMDRPRESGANRTWNLQNDYISAWSSSLGWADVEPAADPAVFFCLEDFFLPGISQRNTTWISHTLNKNKFPAKYYPVQSLLGLCRGLVHFYWLSASTVLTYGAAKAWNVSKPLEAKKTDFGFTRVFHLWMNL